MILTMEGYDGVRIGSDCDRGVDLSGSDGDRVWVKRRMAMGRHRPWSRGPFSKPEVRCRMGDNGHRDLDPGREVLLDPYFGSRPGQGLFPARSSDHHRPPLGAEA